MTENNIRGLGEKVCATVHELANIQTGEHMGSPLQWVSPYGDLRSPKFKQEPVGYFPCFTQCGTCGTLWDLKFHGFKCYFTPFVRCVELWNQNIILYIKFLLITGEEKKYKNIQGICGGKVPQFHICCLQAFIRGIKVPQKFHILFSVSQRKIIYLI